MVDALDRGAPSNLRGWLSDVYFPALIARETRALERRLGDRATLDEPLFGRASGADSLGRRLGEIATWLADHRASFERSGFVMGSDRDVTEGSLALTVAGRTVDLPVAVVAERRRERAVELRVYHSTHAIRVDVAGRQPLLDPDEESAVPPPVAAYIDALARGDLEAVVSSFEDGTALRDGRGRSYVKHEAGGTLRAYYEEGLVDAGKGSRGGTRLVTNARADDGRTCALEYTVVCVRGDAVPPRPGLAVFERGESGLLRALRVYEDVDAKRE
jgi:hypothetical protein